MVIPGGMCLERYLRAEIRMFGPNGLLVQSGRALPGGMQGKLCGFGLCGFVWLRVSVHTDRIVID